MTALARTVSRNRVAAALAFGALTMSPAAAFADNPIVQTSYTADPAPMVYDGRLYVYTSHDEDVTVNNFFTMNDWRLYSTVDMVNWTDHGSPAGYKNYSWGTGDAWAVQCVPRNGKFYLYTPINNSTGSKIGVLVGNSPTGPFTDPLGKALISTGSGNIDPTVFIDDDGQAYLYWGNPDLYYVKLNTDMISFPGSTTKVSLTTAGFGVRSNTDRATAYEEGPWFYKRGSLYYIVYPADGTPEKISYTTSSGPLGPWTYRGDIMAKETGSAGSFTNHPGVIDYKGHSYFFYHNAALPGGGGYKRSVCVEEFSYGADGTIPTIKMTTAGPAAVANLDPFQQVEAETIAFSSGLKTEVCTDTGGGMDVTQISNGDYVKVKGVDFGTGAVSFDARVASAASGGTIELHLDSQTGTLVGSCSVPGTGGAQTWMTKSCAVSGATGLHDLYLKFTGGSGSSLFNFNWWKFTPVDAPDAGAPDGAAGAGGVAGASGKGGAAGAEARGGSGGVPGGGGRGGGVAGGGVAGGGVAGGGVAGTIGRGGASGPGGAAGEASGRGGAVATGGTTGSAGAPGAGRGGSSGGIAGSSVAGTSGPAGGAGGGTSGESAGCGCQSSPGGGEAPATVIVLLLAIAFRGRSVKASRTRRA